MNRFLPSALFLGLLLGATPAQAFCVINESSVPITVRAGGSPPIYVKPNLAPGQRDCYEPRKPEGILVEIVDTSTGQVRCRQSVPAKYSSVIFGKTCRVKLD